MTTIEEKLEIYRAYWNGAKIQWRPDGSVEDWEDMDSSSFDYGLNEYRIKPEPEQQEKKVAYAFVSENGAVVWRTNELIPDAYFMKNFTRAPEFDIEANETSK